MNPRADEPCPSAECPWDLPPGHRIKDHPSQQEIIVALRGTRVCCDNPLCSEVIHEAHAHVTGIVGLSAEYYCDTKCEHIARLHAQVTSLAGRVAALEELHEP